MIRGAALRGHLPRVPPAPRSSADASAACDDRHLGAVRGIYERWRDNPSNVTPAWDAFFKSVSDSENPDLTEVILVHRLIESYQARGFDIANSELTKAHTKGRKDDLTNRCLSEHSALLNRVRSEIRTDRIFSIPSDCSYVGGETRSLSVPDIIARLEDAYCSDGIGLECTHLNSFEQRDYLQKRFEPRNRFELARADRKLLAIRLIRSVQFDEFVNHNFPDSKNHTLQGSELLIPCLNAIIDSSAAQGVDHFVFGSSLPAHPNLLWNVFNQSLTCVMSKLSCPEIKTSGVVDSVSLNKVSQRKTRLTLSGISSASALGRAKSEQMMRSDPRAVLPVLVHDGRDFSASGKSYEIARLSQFPEFDTHGVVHVVFNSPSVSDRNSIGCSSTDLGKSINAPIFHVNFKNPEAAIHVATIASHWRNAFSSDCIIELIIDTKQPQDSITTSKKIPDWYRRYLTRLQKEQIITSEEIEDYKNKYAELLVNAFDKSKPSRLSSLGFVDAPKVSQDCREDEIVSPTGIREDEIVKIANVVCLPPKKYPIPPDLLVTLIHRSNLLENKFLDWNLSEAVAFGSLLKNGIHVRLSTRRNHYIPLENLDQTQAKFTLANPPVSNSTTLDFEFGYSQCDPRTLVVFDSESESAIENLSEPVKPSGIIINIKKSENFDPERFFRTPDADSDSLESRLPRNCDWIVASPTTPANYFHLLRRQVMSGIRKPLINVLSDAKSDRIVVSELNEIASGTSFQKVIVEDSNPQHVKSVAFCCGNIYYDMVKAREMMKKDGEVVIVRIEQIVPFPYDLLLEEIEKYRNVNFYFIREQWNNTGLSRYCIRRLKSILKEVPLRIITTGPLDRVNGLSPSERLDISKDANRQVFKVTVVPGTKPENPIPAPALPQYQVPVDRPFKEEEKTSKLMNILSHLGGVL